MPQNVIIIPPTVRSKQLCYAPVRLFYAGHLVCFVMLIVYGLWCLTSSISREDMRLELMEACRT